MALLDCTQSRGEFWDGFSDPFSNSHAASPVNYEIIALAVVWLFTE